MWYSNIFKSRAREAFLYGVRFRGCLSLYGSDKWLIYRTDAEEGFGYTMGLGGGGGINSQPADSDSGD